MVQKAHGILLPAQRRHSYHHITCSISHCPMNIQMHRDILCPFFPRFPITQFKTLRGSLQSCPVYLNTWNGNPCVSGRQVHDDAKPRVWPDPEIQRVTHGRHCEREVLCPVLEQEVVGQHIGREDGGVLRCPGARSSHLSALVISTASYQEGTVTI